LQHGWFGPPHAVAAPLRHTTPASSISPLGTHCVPVLQAEPAHAVPLEHGGWNGPPHTTHEPALHDRFAPLHAVPVEQQGWFGPPQPAQPVAVQRSPVAHVPPGARHVRVPCASQQPPVHVLPPQHGWVGPPHAAQKPAAHAAPDAMQLPPAQQISPRPPHAAH
jgi:hypothetical protein